MPTVPRDRLLGELIAVREYARLRRHPVYRGRELADGAGQSIATAGQPIDADGRPVLLIPAFLTPDRAMAVMGGCLHRTGHRPARAHVGINIGCAEDQARRLERRLERLAERSGRRAPARSRCPGGDRHRREPGLAARLTSAGARRWAEPGGSER